MRKIILSTLLMGALAFSVELVTDSDLEEVYAGNLYFSDVVYKTSSISGSGGGSGSPYNLVNSVFLDGNAQQNSFAPINAANSAVSQAINLVIIMGDVKGNVDIDFNNNLNSNLNVVQ